MATKKSTPKVPSLNYSAFLTSRSDVARGWWSNLPRWGKLLVLAGAAVALASVGLAKDPQLAILYFFLIGSVAMGGYGHKRVSSFAADNGFEYVKEFSGKQMIARTALSRTGRSHKSMHILKSDGYKHDLPPFVAFSHRYTIGSGKNRRNIDTAVLKVNLGKSTPHYLLDDLDNGKSGGFWSLGDDALSLSHLKQLELEGDFQEHFHLYRDEDVKDQVDILSILTPDFMQWLISLDSAYDIEFIDQHMYVFGKMKTIVNDTVMRDMIRIAAELIPRVTEAYRYYIPD